MARTTPSQSNKPNPARRDPPPQTTLAEQFLADFDDEEDEGVVDQMAAEAPEEDGEDDGDDQDVKMAEEDAAEIEKLREQALKGANTIKDVVRLHGSQPLAHLLKEIEKFWDPSTADFKATTKAVDIDKEYDVIVKSNEFSLAIQEEVTRGHRFVRDIYTHKFPELETIVLFPLDYIRVVKKIGNETDLSKVDMNGIIQQANIITLTLTASNTTGKPLSPADLAKCLEACDVCLDLDAQRQKILAYVESRMKFYAPNITAIVGSTITAQLIGIAGGLKKLAAMPATNVQMLGNKRANLAGFSSAYAATRAGFVFYSETVQRMPVALRTRTCRLIAGKLTLSARIDALHESRDGAPGRKMREDIEKKVNKWLDPPPARKEKALPAPDDKPRKHRGGRRARKMKAAYAMTELRKRRNRMTFGKASEEIGNTFEDLGQLGMEGSGMLRVTANSEDKGFKIRAKKLKSEKQTSGLATSIYAFTPFQGLELKPNANPVKGSEDIGYFSTTAGFTSSVKPK